MLTKQEREEIAKRFKSCTKVDFSDIYRGLFGIPTPKETTIGEDDKATLNRILDLCDTSDMMELPLDKDGKVIHIGDTVWCDGDKYQVASIRYDTSGLFGVEVYIRSAVEMFRAFWRSPKTVTHIEPISDHERIAQEIEEIADANKGTVTEEDLRLVAEEIRELGECNE